MSELDKTVSFFFVLALVIAFAGLWLFGVIDPSTWIDSMGHRQPATCAEYPMATGCRQ